MKKAKKTLRVAGFFRELTGERDSAIPALTPQPFAIHNEGLLVQYLRSGVPYIVSPGVVRDVLDGSGPIGSGTILTDGEWAWPDTLAHYVERYHVSLPDVFVDHATSSGFKIPTLTMEDLRTLRLP